MHIYIYKDFSRSKWDRHFFRETGETHKTLDGNVRKTNLQPCNNKVNCAWQKLISLLSRAFIIIYQSWNQLQIYTIIYQWIKAMKSVWISLYILIKIMNIWFVNYLQRTIVLVKMFLRWFSTNKRLSRQQLWNLVMLCMTWWPKHYMRRLVWHATQNHTKVITDFSVLKTPNLTTFKCLSARIDTKTGLQLSL